VIVLFWRAFDAIVRGRRAGMVNRHHCCFVIVIAMVNLVANVFDGSEMVGALSSFFFTSPEAAGAALLSLKTLHKYSPKALRGSWFILVEISNKYILNSNVTNHPLTNNIDLYY